MEKTFNYTDLISFGWNKMKENFWSFAGVVVLYGIWIILFNVLNGVFNKMPLPKGLFFVYFPITQILTLLVQAFFIIGLIKMSLAILEEKKADFGMLFEPGDCYWRYIFVSILYTLIIYAGFILLIVPGIIWSIQFSLCNYFVIDKGLGPIEALKASSRATRGVKWQLFGFGILTGLINMLGLLLLVVGLFATVPIVLIAYALLYRQLMVQTPELAEFGILTAAQRKQNSTEDDY